MEFSKIQIEDNTNPGSNSLIRSTPNKKFIIGDLDSSHFYNNKLSNFKKFRSYVDSQVDGVTQSSLLRNVPTSISSFKSNFLVHSSSLSMKNLTNRNLRQKCTALYIGGSSHCGIATSLKPAACDRIRCTKCNYLVTRYKGTIFGMTYTFGIISNNTTR